MFEARMTLETFPREEILARAIPSGINPLVLEPEEWREHFGEPVTGMFYMNTDIRADEPTEVYCFFSGTHLGVAVICRDYDQATFRPGKPGFTWDADAHVGVDVYLDPGLSGTGVVILSMNPAGGHVQKAFAPGTPYYPYRWENRSVVMPSFWAAICWVAFDDIGLTATAGDVWGFNIMRRDGGRNKEYFGGVSLAPNYDFFKFPEQLCRLRFDHATPLRAIYLDQSTPGVVSLQIEMDSPQALQAMEVELYPCWGDGIYRSLPPAHVMDCVVVHGLADRVLCELRVYGVRHVGQREDLGRYRFYTPPTVELSLDKPGHRYGPGDEHATILIMARNGQARIDVLDLFRIEDNGEHFLYTLPANGMESITLSLRDLPCGAFVLRGKGSGTVVRPECFFNKVPTQPPPVNKPETYMLSVLTDFPDDVQKNYFDQHHFARYFDFFKGLGVKRVFWMDYGSLMDTWMYRNNPQAHKTFACVGDLLPATLIMVRQRGLEFFATIKPFETGIEGSMYLPLVPESAVTRIEHGFALRDKVGGVELSACDALHHYPGMFFKRRAWQPPYLGPVSEICLYHVDDKSVDVSPGDFTLWVSRDNVQYHLFNGNYTNEEGVRDWKGRRCRYFAFKDLALTDRYVAFTCSRGGGTFVNRTGDFVEVMDDAGKAIEVSVGFSSKTPFPDGTPNTLVTCGPISFNELGWGVIAGQRVDDTFIMLDYPEKALAIGIGRGKDRQLLVPDPSEPQGAEFILSRVRRAIKAGVDGIHLRLMHHHQFMEMQEYGCSERVIAEYRQRYGVDITRAEPEREKLEEINGKYYTELYCRVRELTDKAGIALFLQVPVVQGFMCEFPVKLQWERWIKLGLADAMMLKDVYPGTMLGEALRVLTRRHGIPLYLNPYDKKGTPPKVRETYQRFLARSIAAGHDGYNYYEGGTAIRRGRVGTDEPEFVITILDEQTSALRPGYCR